MNPVQRAVLVTTILASFVAFLDGSIVNVALPAIVRELGGGVVTAQWVVDGYLLSLGALILLAGSISDAFGRKRVLVAGLIGFGVASLGCALAPTAGILIAARFLQGFAGALLVPSSLAMIMSSFSGPAQGLAIGRWTAWTSTAFIAGPLIGGTLVDLVGWRWVFAINVLPIAATLLAVRGIAEPRLLGRRPRLDLIGAVLGAIGLAGPVFALIEQERLGWSSPFVYLPLLVGLVSLAAYFLWERRSQDPMLPLGLFRIRNFAWGNTATLFIYAALSMGPLVVTLFLQQRIGFSAVLAGLATLPGSVLMIALGGRSGALAGRFGSRVMMTVGPILAAVGFAWLLMVREPFDFWTQMLPGLIIFGLGLTATVPALTSAVLGSIPPERNGIASAVNNAVARIAPLIAIACIGIIVAGRLDFVGLHRAALVTATLMLVGAAASFIGIRRPVVSTDAA
jgi:EmrB/QacA subfamily drug resistance transporter